MFCGFVRRTGQRSAYRHPVERHTRAGLAEEAVTSAPREDRHELSRPRQIPGVDVAAGRDRQAGQFDA